MTGSKDKIPLRVLLLVQDEQRVNLDSLYQSIAGALEYCDIRRLNKSEQQNLKKYFRQHINPEAYDRIVFFIRFKQSARQIRFVRTLPNVVMLEHDAYMNYLPHGKYFGKFSKFFRALPWARIIVSGYGLAKKLGAEGFDTVFVPKGYDDSFLRNLNQPRDIELAFVGSTAHRAYTERKKFLDRLSELIELTVTRVASGEEYLHTLNRIRFFVSCDKEFGEYMIKNAEAMACGCILIAYDQGEEENRAMGMVDMENVVLYRDERDVVEKLKRLREDTSLADKIARAGQALAEQRLSNSRLGVETAKALAPPLRKRERRMLLGVLPAGYRLATSS